VGVGVDQTEALVLVLAVSAPALGWP